MAKKIFIIAAPGREKEAAACEQILREYDYDVVNPRIVEPWEAYKARLGLFDDDYGWLKRDIRKLLDCDGYCLLEEGNPGSDEWEYETNILEVAQVLPMFIGQVERDIEDWIDLTIELSKEPDADN